MTDTAINALDLLDGPATDTLRRSDDKAPHDPQALSVARLERWLDEIRHQPAWRREADQCADYYDNNQLDAETLSELQSRGLGALVTNLIAPTINTVLGMEAKTRTDWTVNADDDAWTDVADALSSKIHEAERETGADHA